ncbi:MAG: hypothetical protein AB7M12_05620, partial [Hyphomonadaceae bacterium]
PNNETIQPIISPSYAQAFSKSNFAASMRAFYARRTLGRIARRRCNAVTTLPRGKARRVL